MSNYYISKCCGKTLTGGWNCTGCGRICANGEVTAVLDSPGGMPKEEVTQNNSSWEKIEEEFIRTAHTVMPISKKEASQYAFFFRTKWEEREEEHQRIMNSGRKLFEEGKKVGVEETLKSLRDSVKYNDDAIDTLEEIIKYAIKKK